MKRTLETQTFGNTDAPECLLIAHGLFGSGRNWRTLARRLATDRFVVTVDMRNHGNSFRDPSQTYADMAGDLAQVAYDLARPVHVLGHSMGGKAAMVLALTHDIELSSLIVADIAPVAYSHTQLHLIKAMQSLDLKNVRSRKDADELLSVNVSNAQVRAFLLQSLSVDNDKVDWLLNLEALTNNMSAIIGFPDIESTSSTRSLFINGQNSDYVRTEHQPLIQKHFPNTKFSEVPNAGHWLHAENPKAFLDQTHDFLNAASI